MEYGGQGWKDLNNMNKKLSSLLLASREQGIQELIKIGVSIVDIGMICWAAGRIAEWRASKKNYSANDLFDEALVDCGPEIRNRVRKLIDKNK